MLLSKVKQALLSKNLPVLKSKYWCPQNIDYMGLKKTPYAKIMEEEKMTKEVKCK